MNVHVTPVNDNPTARNDAASTPSSTPVVIAVLANDTDVDGDRLTVIAVTQPAGGSAAIAGDGTHVLYTPNAGFGGVAQFVYTVGDGQGGTATATVRVAVRPNRAPRALPDVASTVAPTPITIAVLGNDTDPDGDPLQVSAVTQPNRGSAVISDGNQTLHLYAACRLRGNGAVQVRRERRPRRHEQRDGSGERHERGRPPDHGRRPGRGSPLLSPLR